jgi:hypothetical protein
MELGQGVLLGRERPESGIRMLKRATKKSTRVTIHAKESTKGSSLAHGGIILKEKKRIKSVEPLDDVGSKHEHCKVAMCKNCNKAYSLCFNEASCEYHPRKHIPGSHFAEFSSS